MGKNIDVNTTLERVRDALRDNRKVAREAFEILDTDHDGCLNHMEVLLLARKFVKGALGLRPAAWMRGLGHAAQDPKVLLCISTWILAAAAGFLLP